MRLVSILLALGLTLALSACGIPRKIDSEVQSFVGTAGAAVGATYRFERLPSQQSQPELQERVEALAQTALQRVGLTRDDLRARYSVQVEAQVVQFPAPLGRHAHLIPPYVNADGSPAYSPLAFLSEPPWYQHSVRLVLRDIQSGQIAYETSAHFEGPWSDSDALWPAIMEAALRDYPHPPQGPHKVIIELPRNGQQTHER